MSLMRPAGTQFHLASVLIGVSQNDAGTTSFRHVKSQSIHIRRLMSVISHFQKGQRAQGIVNFGRPGGHGDLEHA